MDVTNIKTIDWCDQMIKRIREDSRSGHIMFVGVGTKIDLVGQRQVSKKFAKKHFSDIDPSIEYFETSGLTGEGVQEAIENIIRLWIPWNKRILAKRISKDCLHLSEGRFDKQIKEMIPGCEVGKFWFCSFLLFCVLFIVMIILMMP